MAINIIAIFVIVNKEIICIVVTHSIERERFDFRLFYNCILYFIMAFIGRPTPAGTEKRTLKQR